MQSEPSPGMGQQQLVWHVARQALVSIRTAELNLWAARLADHFRLNIVAPPVVIRPLNGCLGIYHWEYGRFGLIERIFLDEKHVMEDEPWEGQSTLGHELFHCDERHHGHPPRGTFIRYHTSEFRRKARSKGLIVDSSGRTRPAPGSTPFSELLRMHGIQVPDRPDDTHLPAHETALERTICEMLGGDREVADMLNELKIILEPIAPPHLATSTHDKGEFLRVLASAQAPWGFHAER